ncbi:MAG: hypothetical protein ACYC2U_04850 [Candidatus Amoebophilus sp.]
MTVDFILPSCPGIPEALWITASLMLASATKLAWVILGGTFSLRFLSDVYTDFSGGQISIRTHIITIFHAVLVGVFLNHYKFFLMVFDNFIDLISLSDTEIIAKVVPAASAQDTGTGGSLPVVKELSFLKRTLFKYILEPLLLVSHEGAIWFMHYLKIISLLVTALLGPFAAAFSLLPGFSIKRLAGWAKIYVSISSWAITLNIFWVLTQVHRKIFVSEQGLASGEGIAYLLTSIGLFLAIFQTPTFTAKFVGYALSANIGGGVDTLARKGTSLARTLLKLFKR